MSEFESKVEADLILPVHIVETIKQAEKNGCKEHRIQLLKLGDIYTAKIWSETDAVRTTNIITIAIRRIQDGKINA